MQNPSHRRLRGYLAGRATALLALLVLASVFQARRGGVLVPFAWFFAATAASFAFTLASALVLRKGAALRPFWTKVQPAWDVAYATVLVYLSGGAFSPLATLYPLAIIGGAILLLRRGALVVATASSVAYGLLADLQFNGVLTPLNPFPLPAGGGAKPWLQLLFHLVAFYAIALLSGYLAEELRRTGERLEEMEAEVLDLEHLKESILHSLGSGLVALDGRGRELFHNQAAEKYLARAGVELNSGMDLAGIFDLHGEDRKEAVFRGGRVILGYSVSPLFDRDSRRRGSLLVFQDLTKIKRLEDQLRRADRLAAVGRLAAGLAHEIRNPLASLSGSVEVLRQSIAPGAHDGTLYKIVLRETDRLNQLVTNFLHYARPGRTQHSKVPLREIVEETGFFFTQGEGKNGFALTNKVPEDVHVLADRGQLEQVFLNLFRNSVEAAPEGVAVTVEAEAEDAAVTLVVRDDGPGMPPHVSERIFEPFFTGKQGGTGLGLATVHRIVEDHGGSIALETAAGQGATFRLRFPVG